MQINQSELSLRDNITANSHGNLELFKMLLQPHFLFNSLNNLYALSVKRSDQTADAIAGLSALLTRVVSALRRNYITLEDEVNLIEEYIKLENIWLQETSFLLDFQVSGELDKVMIPPLLIYTFVENSFKHGIRKCSGKGWLTIKILVKSNTLFFRINNLVPSIQEDDRNGEQEGLGIVAARELLDNKCYGRYHLETGRKGNVYSVDLRIENV